MTEAAARHAEITAMSQAQGGLISRPQLRSVGWSDHAIRAQLSAGRISRVVPGVYSTSFTIEPGVPTLWWAAILHFGASAAIADASALQAWGLRTPALPVNVAVAWGKRPRLPDTRFVVWRRAIRLQVRDAPGGLPTLGLEEVALDIACRANSTADVASSLTDVLSTGPAMPARLARAASARKRLRNRDVIDLVLREIRDGSTSPLEVAGVRRVLRGHGLPPGRGQVRETVRGSVAIRDRVIKEFGVVIEFDGRLGNADPTSRLRDHVRDNRVAAQGRVTLRFGWVDVHEEACESASQVAQILGDRGWAGHLEPCGPACRAVRR